MACFAGGASWASSPRRWTKALALTWGPIVSLAVVATGNHYVFDIVAGLLVSALGYVVGPLAARLATRWMASTTAAVDGRARSLALVET